MGIDANVIVSVWDRSLVRKLEVVSAGSVDAGPGVIIDTLGVDGAVVV